MQGASAVAIVEGLNAAGARYLIAGGLAVVAHGHVRFTADVDIVLDMSGANLERAIRALGGLGYRPRARPSRSRRSRTRHSARAGSATRG
jgi:hypothetical protein